MKKSKKMLSVFCALSLLLVALPAASAVESEPLSEYAGQTIAVQVVEDSGVDLISRIVKITIPEGATEAEKDALIYTAVTGKTPLSARGDTVDFLYQENKYVEILPTPVKIAEGTTTMQLDELYVHMKFAGAPANGLQLQVRNSFNDTSNWKGVTFVNTPDPYYEVIFYSSDLGIRENTNISVWAKVPSGVAKLNYCYMAGLKR